MDAPSARRLAATLALAITTVTMLTAGAGRPAGPPEDQAAPPISFNIRALSDDGQPVRDLKPGDLSLKVDGRARDVHSLELVTVGGALAPPFASNVMSDLRRDVVILVDDESFAPGAERLVREGIGELLDGLSPNDRVRLMTMLRGGVNVGPTSQHADVRSALATMMGRAPRAENSSDAACRTRILLDALTAVFATTSKVSHTVVVFVSGGVAPVTAGGTFQIGTPNELCEIRNEQLQQFGAIVQASQADFYGVQVVNDVAASFAALSGLTAGLENLIGVARGDLLRLTGISQASMRRVARETAAYYVVAFDPQASERNGADHRIDLRVNRERVTLRAPASIAIEKADDRPADTSVLTVRDMLRTAEVYRDLPMRAACYASRNAGDDQVKVVVLFEPIEPTVKLKSVLIGLVDDKGRVKAQWTARPEELAGRPAMAALTVPAGAYRMRLAATDGSGRGGTVDQDIRAALTEAGPVKLSGLLLGTSPGQGFAPRLQFVAEPILVGYLEVYGVTKEASVSGTIDLAESESAPAMAAVPATLSVAKTNDLRTLHGAFSIEGLLPGDYVMRASVTVDGKVVGRVSSTLRKVAR